MFRLLLTITVLITPLHGDLLALIDTWGACP
jgi:hypothetical protein